MSSWVASKTNAALRWPGWRLALPGEQVDEVHAESLVGAIRGHSESGDCVVDVRYAAVGRALNDRREISTRPAVARKAAKFAKVMHVKYGSEVPANRDGEWPVESSAKFICRKILKSVEYLA